MTKKRSAFYRKSNRYVTAAVLRKVAAAMYPFYQAIAFRKDYALHWSKAVVKADLSHMQKLLRPTAPIAAKQGLGCNGIGYFISFTFPRPIYQYTNGITIPPGTVQFTFEAKAHQHIARHILPLYRKLITSRCFRLAFAKAIRWKATNVINLMVRSLVKTKALMSVRIEYSGVMLVFRFAGSKYPYQLLLFRDIA